MSDFGLILMLFVSSVVDLYLNALYGDSSWMNFAIFSPSQGFSLTVNDNTISLQVILYLALTFHLILSPIL